MKRIKDKLRDNRGVTVLMALFALLLASMVCIVILGASLTTVKQSKADQQHEQDMLLLQSAGELIGSNIGNGAVEVTYKTIYTSALKDDGKTYGEPAVSHEGPSITKGNCLIKSELENAVEEVLANPSTDYTSAPTFNIILNGTTVLAAEEGENSSESTLVDVDGSTVKVAYTLRHGNHDEQTEGTGLDYQLIFTFTLGEGDSPETAQILYVKMSSTKQDPIVENSGKNGDPEITTTITETYSWGKPEYYVANGQGV